MHITPCNANTIRRNTGHQRLVRIMPPTTETRTAFHLKTEKSPLCNTLKGDPSQQAHVFLLKPSLLKAWDTLMWSAANVRTVANVFHGTIPTVAPSLLLALASTTTPTKREITAASLHHSHPPCRENRDVSTSFLHKSILPFVLIALNSRILQCTCRFLTQMLLARVGISELASFPFSQAHKLVVKGYYWSWVTAIVYLLF